LQLDRSATGDFISFVKAAPAKRDNAGAIFEFGSGVDGAEGKLGAAVIADLEIGRFDEIVIVAIPKIGLETGRTARFKGYWLEMVAVVPSNLVKLTVNGSLYVFALFLRKLSATASPSSKAVSLSLRQWMPEWIP
jgi:hypothetical protein